MRKMETASCRSEDDNLMSLLLPHHQHSLESFRDIVSPPITATTKQPTIHHIAAFPRYPRNSTCPTEKQIGDKFIHNPVVKT